MSIQIKTRLNKGIYASQGGGQVKVKHEWKTGPRNLLVACRELPAHRELMVRCYGNIGCGQSWLEIDGVSIDDYDLPRVDDQSNTMDYASKLINIVQSGEYVPASEWIKQAQEEQDHQDHQKDKE